MSTLQAIILGIVQGATEFLPISSSGHLVIFKHLFGLNLESGLLFDSLLHVGTLIAVVFAYTEDVLLLIREGFGLVFDCIRWLIREVFVIFTHRRIKKVKLIETQERKLLILLMVASIPTAIIGFSLKDIFESTLQKPFTVGIALLITGGLLYITDRIPSHNKTTKDIKYSNAVVIGLFQGIAITPGISRSGSTIAAGLFNGLNREFAIKFSFLLSIPAILGAALLNLKDVSAEHIQVNYLPMFIGMLASALIGFICIKLLIVLLRNKKYHYFAYYCWAVGLISIIWGLMAG